MPRFYFSILDEDGIDRLDASYEFEDIRGAAEEARKTLAEMAMDGLPPGPMNMLAVEVFDENRAALFELRLILEVIPK